MSKETKIHNEEKTALSINDVGKTRPLYAKESKWITFLYQIQK